MKKLRLKRWVKITLLVLLLIVLLIINKKSDEDFIKDCVAGGNTKEYCETQL